MSRLRLLAFVAVAGTGLPAAAAGQTLTIAGPADTVTVTASQLAALPRETVRARIHEDPERAWTGVQLHQLIKLVKYPIDSLRGRRLSDVLVAEAADGYRAIFSLAELAPDLGGRGALLVDRADGAPLPATDGPFRLLVPYETRPTRWVRQVVRLRIVSIPQ
ncbi:MAG: hypothetical protein AB7S39_17860 [Gemmatimonadales bacterium]